MGICIQLRQLLSTFLLLTIVIINIACTNVLNPMKEPLAQVFNITEGQFSTLLSAFLLTTAISALFWGYQVDRLPRKRVMFISACLWSSGMLMAGAAPSFGVFCLAFIVTACGLGSVLPFAYSIFADLVDSKHLSTLMGWLAVLSSISNGIGQAIAQIFIKSNFRFAFFVLFLVSMVLAFLFLFLVEVPQRARTEQILKDVEHLEYNYNIERKDIPELLKIKTNRWLLIQGFISIIPGTVLSLYLLRLFNESLFISFPETYKNYAALVFAAMAGAGYLLGNMILSPISDRIARKNRRNRVLLALICVSISVPLIIICYNSLEAVQFTDLKVYSEYLAMVAERGTKLDGTDYFELMIFAHLVGDIFIQHPVYWVYLFLGLVVSFFTSGFTFNRETTMLEVNLPEHRGTAGSFYALVEQCGKSLTPLLGALIMAGLGGVAYMKPMMMLLTLLWLPCIYLWYNVYQTVEGDMDHKTAILLERKALLQRKPSI